MTRHAHPQHGPRAAMPGIFMTMMLAVSLAVPAGATTYYVAPDGNNTDPGTEASPWQTIGFAACTLSPVNAGDTVLVRQGTYNEAITLMKTGSPGEWITFAAYPGETATIDGQGIPLEPWEALFEIRGKDYIRVSGFRIQNSQWAGIIVSIEWGPNIPSSHITIDNNDVYNAYSSGIVMGHGSNYIVDGNTLELCNNAGPDAEVQEILSIQCDVDTFEISNNHIFNGGEPRWGGEGINAKYGVSNGTIHHNHVHHVYRVGIYVDAFATYQSNIEVYENVVHNTAAGLGAVAEELGGVLDNCDFYNNICYDNCWSLFIGSDNGTVRNCTFVNNTFWNNINGIEIGLFDSIPMNGPIEDVTVRNNVVSQNRDWQITRDYRPNITGLMVDHNLIDGFRDWPNEICGSDSVIGDPEFVDAGSADFHIESTSPAIDRGSPLGAPDVDIDGDARPQEMGFDIGVDEYYSVTGVEGNSGESLPDGCGLFQNHPNPFNGGTLISYVLTRPGKVRLTIFDVLGREVVTLVDGHQDAGHDAVSWDGVDSDGQQCATGMYFCSLQTGGQSVARKLVLVR